MATIEYNVAAGTARMDSITITSWKQEMILAPDGVSVEGQRHTVIGDGIISGTNAANYNAAVLAFRKEWNDRGGSLIIDYEGNDIIALAEGDHFLGPHVKYNLTELTHFSSMVNFEIQFDYFEITTDPLVSVASHTWTQRFVVDEAGLSTYFVTGKLRTHREGIAPEDDTGAAGAWDGVTDDADNAPSGDPSNYLIGANPDRYRQVVLPELPLGFRVKRMEFAIDESQQRLIYSIEMFQSPRSLPAPAKKGSANFRWRKSLNSGTGMVGLKVVDIELEAGKDTSPAKLLATAYKISQEMINYSGAGADLVLEVEFEQPDLFNKNAIVYRVVAQGNSLPPNAPNGPLQPLNVDLVQLGLAIEGFDQYAPPGPYAIKAGDDALVIQTIYRIKQALTRHQPDHPPSLALKRAQVEEADINVVEQTYRIPTAVYEDLTLEDDPGHEDSSPATTGEDSHVAFNYLSVETIEEISVEDTGMRILRPRALSSIDIPFQIHKPIVLLTSRAIIQRRGKSPERTMLKMPLGGVMRSETFSVSPGKLDANNNRIYTATHERIIELADPGGDDNIGGFQNLAHTIVGMPLGAGQFTFRTWWPPNALIAFPHDPTIEFGTDARARSLLETHGEAPEFDYGLHQELANHYFNGVG